MSETKGNNMDMANETPATTPMPAPVKYECRECGHRSAAKTSGMCCMSEDGEGRHRWVLLGDGQTCATDQGPYGGSL